VSPEDVGTTIEDKEKKKGFFRKMLDFFMSFFES
jgi:hypothetical protein